MSIFHEYYLDNIFIEYVSIYDLFSLSLVNKYYYKQTATQRKQYENMFMSLNQDFEHHIPIETDIILIFDKKTLDKQLWICEKMFMRSIIKGDFNIIEYVYKRYAPYIKKNIKLKVNNYEISWTIWTLSRIYAIVYHKNDRLTIFLDKIKPNYF